VPAGTGIAGEERGMIPHNIAGVFLFALLIALVLLCWQGRHRVKFRYVVLAFIVLVIVLSVIWK
jgi:hypothetical protein